MFNLIKMKLPIVFSAYSAALFIFFAFVYQTNIDYFVWINLLVFSIWSAYTWFVIWRQSLLIRDMVIAMDDIENTIMEVIERAVEEIEEEERLEKESKRVKKKKAV